MGIRVHKMIGYGLVDIKVDGYTCIDPRINMQGIITNWEDPFESAQSYFDYLQSIEAAEKHKPARERKFLAHLDMSILRTASKVSEERLRLYDPKSAVVWKPEYGMASVLCIRPVASLDWLRYDEMIDWCEETEFSPGGKSQRNWMKFLQGGIFPFNGRYMDSRDGSSLPMDAALEYVRMTHYADQWGVTDSELRDQARDLLVKRLPFDSLEECEAHFAPYVPQEIRSLCEWGNAFTDPNVVFQLRPMMYVYWE